MSERNEEWKDEMHKQATSLRAVPETGFRIDRNMDG